jgi:hypothetical protein
MKNYDSNLAAELAKDFLTMFFLVEGDFSTTLYLADFDIPVTFNGHVYQPSGFSFSDISLSSQNIVDSVNIAFDDVNGAMSYQALSQDIRNKTVKVAFGVMLQNMTTYCNQLFQGFVGEWTSKEKDISTTIVNEFIFWSKRTLRNCPSSCPWVFKQTECAYAGGQSWCDQSYANCLALGNNLNFGGFRYLPACMETPLWWGRQSGA